jgi:UMF1 family MFS transporter
MTVATAQSVSSRRARWAWYLYDFGNSAYAAVVLLAVYSAYFQGEVVGGAEGSRLWGLAVAIAMLAVAVTSPLLGAIADFSGPGGGGDAAAHHPGGRRAQPGQPAQGVQL